MTRRVLHCCIIILVLNGSNAIAAIQPKIGDSCLKIGATKTIKNINLICAKQKGKLIWKKVNIGKSDLSNVGKETSPQSSPSPSPSPSSSPSPTTSPTSKSQLRSIVTSNNFRIIADLAKVKTDAKYEMNSIINESMDLEIVKNIQKRYQFSINFWQEVLGNQKFYVIFGNNDDILWIKTQLEKISPYKYDDWYQNFTKNMPAARCESYSAGAYGGHKDFYLQSFTLYSNVCREKEPRDDNFRTTVEHELTHAAQQGFTKNQNELLPCWFKEGHAQYYGSLLGNINNYDGFLTSRAYPFQRFKVQNFSEQLINLDEKYDNFKCGTDGGYTIGSLAIENLLSISSHQTINQFMIDTGFWKNWRVAFQKNFGLDFETWATNLRPEPV